MKVVALKDFEKYQVSLETLKRMAIAQGIKIGRHLNPENNQQMLTISATDTKKLQAKIAEFAFMSEKEITIRELAKIYGVTLSGMTKHLKKADIAITVKRSASGQRAKCIKKSDRKKIKIKGSVKKAQVVKFVKA